MTTRIAGRLDHRAMALLHRPTDAALLAREVHRLAALGLTNRDIAEAMRLAPEQVAGLLNTETRPLEPTSGVSND